jgi:predicted RNA-binding Zn-ribbon protein involved in translation (DUF1610 family)
VVPGGHGGSSSGCDQGTHRECVEATKWELAIARPWRPAATYCGLVRASKLELVHGVYRFSCPRCGQDVAERFYGPCGQCRHDLNEAHYRPPATGPGTERARFEPKMNVVSNDVTARVEPDEPEEGQGLG